MNKLFSILAITFIALAISSCNKEENNNEPGSVDIRFDNVAITNNVMQQLNLVPAGSKEYAYINGLNQKYNISLLRYYISAIELSGPNGEVFKDEVKADATSSKGYYLVDEAKSESQLINLTNVPAGTYNKITFTIGVDSSGVVNGAVGGVLDPATSKMFWNWNSGYIALKYEGQSDVSNGGAGGELINNIPNGMAYHIGGWKNIPGSAFVYNNKKVSFSFDTQMILEKGETPEIHMTFDVLKLFNGHHKVDFTGNHNVHKPSDAVDLAHNMEEAFNFDHIHQ